MESFICQLAPAVGFQISPAAVEVGLETPVVLATAEVGLGIFVEEDVGLVDIIMVVGFTEELLVDAITVVGCTDEVFTDIFALEVVARDVVLVVVGLPGWLAHHGGGGGR